MAIIIPRVSKVLCQADNAEPVQKKYLNDDPFVFSDVQYDIDKDTGTWYL